MPPQQNMQRDHPFSPSSLFKPAQKIGRPNTGVSNNLTASDNSLQSQGNETMSHPHECTFLGSPSVGSWKPRKIPHQNVTPKWRKSWMKRNDIQGKDMKTRWFSYTIYRDVPINIDIKQLEYQRSRMSKENMFHLRINAMESMREEQENSIKLSKATKRKQHYKHHSQTHAISGIFRSGNLKHVS